MSEQAEINHMKAIPGYTDYHCDRAGNIYSTKSGNCRQMKVRVGSRGYNVICLYPEPGRQKYELVHRVVAATWIRPPNPNDEVNHKNGDKTDNRVENLEWTTRLENERHSWCVLGKNIRGEKHVLSKLCAAQIEELRCLRANGWTLEALAKKFGIGLSQTHRIVRRKKWAHVQ